MSIKDLLSRKPSWQHTDPEIRIEAISSLTDQEILHQLICNDPIEKVRHAAISQLTDFESLTRLATEPDDIGPVARQQFCRILASSDTPDNCKALIENIEDIELLKAVTLSSNGPDITLLALGKLDDEKLLVEISCNASTKQVRETAANKINSVGNLEILFKQSRNKDKLVHNIAKAKLQQLNQRQKEKKQHMDDAALIVSELKQLISQGSQSSINSSINSSFKRTLSHLQSKWQILEPEFGKFTDEADQGEINSLRAAFDSAKTLCLEQISQAQREAEKEVAAREEAESICQQLTGMLQKVKQSIDGLQQHEENYRELGKQWHNLPHQGLLPELKETYYSLTSKLEFLFDANNRWRKLQEQIGSNPGNEDASTEAGENHAKSLARFQWPEDFPPPQELVDARKSIEASKIKEPDESRKQPVDQAKLEENLSKMEQEIQAGHIRAAAKIQKQLHQALKGHPHPGRAREKLQRLTSELTELRDWQGYATNPKREELCNKMQELVDMSIHPTDRAARIKELHTQWKALGDSHDDQKHWYRFKQASDLAYEPCKVYFAEQAEERKQRLLERKKICEQLETFNKQVNWDTVNWKALTEIISTARKQWRELGPVDHGQRKNIQSRFYRILDALHEHLVVEQKRNQDLKQNLIEQVDQLAGEEDLNQAIKKTIILQKEWKQIGVMDRKMDQKLWKRFRKSCDEVFNRRSEQKKAENAEEMQQMVEAENYCKAIEDLTGAPLEETLPSRSKLGKIKSEFNSLDLSPRVRKKIQRRFADACVRYEALIEAYGTKKQLGSFLEMKRKADVCAQLEREIEQGTAGQFSADELAARWTTEQELPARTEDRLNERWQKAMNQALNADSSFQTAMELNTEAARLIAIRMEILTELESPEKDQQARMAYQVNRLKKELSEGVKETRSLSEQFSSLQEDWFCLGAIPGQEFIELDKRILTATEKFTRISVKS
jgi:hypothetical protein